MRVIGVDPGTRRLGWGVVEREGTRIHHVAHGTISMPTGVLAERLVRIDHELSAVIAAHAPEVGAVETIFFAKNAQSAAKLGHARGVVLLCLSRAGLDVGEYPPATVKRAVAGGGRAEKHQVARMIAGLLRLGEAPQEDAADALAVAVTHLNTLRFARAVATSRSLSARRPLPAG